MLDDGQTVRRPGAATVTGNTMGRIIRRKRTVVYYLLNRKHPSLTETCRTSLIDIPTTMYYQL